MAKENAGIKKRGGTINWFLEETKQWIHNKKYGKICTSLNYAEHYLS